MPLIMLATERLADGRLVSLARFEIWPSLGAAAAVGVAIAAYGLLRRHWRLAGLEVEAADRVIPQARVVWVCGWISVAVYAAHLLLLGDVKLLAILMPIFGGLFEMVVLWFFWMAILELWRHGRPLRLSWRLWAGMVLAWIPPSSNLALYLLRWSP